MLLFYLIFIWVPGVYRANPDIQKTGAPWIKGSNTLLYSWSTSRFAACPFPCPSSPTANLGASLFLSTQSSRKVCNPFRYLRETLSFISTNPSSLECFLLPFLPLSFPFIYLLLSSLHFSLFIVLSSPLLPPLIFPTCLIPKTTSRKSYFLDLNPNSFLAQLQHNIFFITALTKLLHLFPTCSLSFLHWTGLASCFATLQQIYRARWTTWQQSSQLKEEIS